MGYAIHYSTVDPVAADVARAIQRDVDQICKAYTWLSCEPLNLSDDGTGRLWGGSKPTFEPDAGDAASAAAEGLPDGTVVVLLEALCELSRSHGIDWQVGDDFEVHGYIHNGEADSAVVRVLNGIGEMAELSAEMMAGPDSDEFTGADPDSGVTHDSEDDDDDESPPTLRLWTE